jgi:hypothetical protein
MSPHSSHLLQPLDVGCFTPLKVGYGRQAENLMRSRINHITNSSSCHALKPLLTLLSQKTISQEGFEALP